jgi:hypothetical protein
MQMGILKVADIQRMYNELLYVSANHVVMFKDIKYKG